jgi:hypothetical protein
MNSDFAIGNVDFEQDIGNSNHCFAVSFGLLAFDNSDRLRSIFLAMNRAPSPCPSPPLGGVHRTGEGEAIVEAAMVSGIKATPQ